MSWNENVTETNKTKSEDLDEAHDKKNISEKENQQINVVLRGVIGINVSA